MKSYGKRQFSLVVTVMVIGLFLAFNTPLYSQTEWTLKTMDQALTEPVKMKALEKDFGNFQPAETIQVFTTAYGQGLVASRQGKMSLAYKYFERAKTLAKIQSTETMAVLRRQIELDIYFNDLRYILERGHELMTVALINDSDFYKALAYRALAEANYQQGKDDEVLSLLSSAGGEFEKSKLQWPKALIYQYQGFIAMSLEDYENAKLYFHKADAQMKDAPHDDLLYSYIIFREFKDILVDVLIKQMDVDTAIRELQKLNQVQNELGESPVATQILMFTAGRLLHEEGRYRLAEVYFDEAVAASEKIISDERHHKNNWQQDVLLYAAMNHYALGEYKEAADYFERAVSTKSGISVEEEISDIRIINAIESKAFYSKINLLDSLARERQAKIDSQRLILTILGLVLLGIFSVIILLYVDYRRINDLRSRLYTESITDHLTRLYNRGKILSILEIESQGKGVVALIDIDHFKRINDSYGHPVGDEVLIKVSQVLQQTIRNSDVVGRFGGEEFLLILKDVDFEQGQMTCERIREAVEAIKWPMEELVTTISIGGVCMNGQSADNLICAADLLLYQAKKSGRNRVIINC